MALRLSAVQLACGLVCALRGGNAQAADCLGHTDVSALVQSSVDRAPWLDVYVTTANTVEDVMYWAVLHQSLKRFHPSHPHWLLIRKDSELNQRAHAIRMAIYGNFWNARLDLFDPDHLNLEAVDDMSWQQLAPFQYGPDLYKRVVLLNADMLALQNIDEMTHKLHNFVMARDHGDCKNLTDALSTTKPSMSLMSIVPNEHVLTWLTSAAARLNVERSEVAPVDMDMGKMDDAGVVALAYEKTHHGHQTGRFATEEVASASCLIHHKDNTLDGKHMLESMKLLYWGEEGKKIISDIISHGEKRKENVLAGLEAAGKLTLVRSIRTWFELYETDKVKAVVDAAKNGPLAEW